MRWFWFGFEIVNFPLLCSNIPPQLAYGIYVLKLVRIGTICENYESFCRRNRTITSKLIKQGFWYSKLCRTFKKFARRHQNVFKISI